VGTIEPTWGREATARAVGRLEASPAREASAKGQRVAAARQPTVKPSATAPAINPGKPRAPGVELLDAERVRLAAIRERLARSFAENQGVYYDPARPDRPLFTALGKKIIAHQTRAGTIRGMLDLAETRGWNAITATGNKEFQRQVWIEANARGMQVALRSDRLMQGAYRPTKQDLETVAKLREARGLPNRIERDPSPSQAAAPARGTSEDAMSGSAKGPARDALNRAAGEAELQADRASGAAAQVRREAPGSAASRDAANLALAAHQAADRAQADRTGATPATVAHATRDARQQAVATKDDERGAESDAQHARGRAPAARIQLAALDAMLELRGASPALRAEMTALARAELASRAAEGRSPRVMVVDPAAPRGSVRTGANREPTREREPQVAVQR
jgi:hypothetical protein